VGIDQATLETWLLGGTSYWGPVGVLPPPGTDSRWPLLANARPVGAGHSFLATSAFRELQRECLALTRQAA
jgi:hypothetical protein